MSQRGYEFGDFVHQVLDEIAKTERKVILGVSTDVAEMLELYPWSEGVFDLYQQLQIAVKSCENQGVMSLDHFQNDFLMRVARHRIYFDEHLKKKSLKKTKNNATNNVAVIKEKYLSCRL